MQAGHAEDGKDQIFAHFLVQAGDDMLLRQRAGFKEFSEKIVLAFGHQLHQFFVSLFGGLCIGGRDFAFLRFPVAIRHKSMCLPSAEPDR